MSNCGPGFLKCLLNGIDIALKVENSVKFFFESDRRIYRSYVSMILQRCAELTSSNR